MTDSAEPDALAAALAEVTDPDGLAAQLAVADAESERLEAHARAGRVMPLVLDAPRAGKPPRHWVDLDAAERVAAVTDAGLPKFRAAQLSKHYFESDSDDPADWTDLPKDLRARVAEGFFPRLLQQVRRQEADGGATIKTLWRLFDGNLIESVVMRYGYEELPASGPGRRRATLCLSSQAGCGMACPFCATGQGGLKRNLTAAEIVAQVKAARQIAPLTNVVFMGMGEPLANYPQVVKALKVMTGEMGMSARGITVSTSGLAPRMRQLATEGLPVTLALSLHTPDDELRDSLVPINQRYDVADAVAAAHEYFEATGRRVSIEYALIRDVNDQAWRATKLAELLAGHGRGTGWVHVNLIPLNPTPGSKWTASRRQDEKEFVRRLEDKYIAVTVRDTRGRDIDGACGQLAATELAG